ncbi:stabilin-2-like, partial [Saccoglossus kowalevskii]|uniref:Stabilin-2-like n=1 Tax=Saccoglossus kowalevskii TaxID=10224 RepID=A0ABM0MWV0_SACKO
GDIYINDGNSKIIERNIFYNSGIVYGIDRVLELPSIGGRCDVITNTTEMSRCYNCRYRTSCPAGAKPSGPIFHDCRYSIGWYEISGGCRQQCVTRHVVSRCCANHFGPDCRECPGGSRNPCNGHGTCNDGYANSGHCSCSSGFTGDACEMCQAGRFGPQCQECQCSEYGTCLDGMTGDGSCFCHYGWTGANCDTMLSIPLPVCNPPCHSDAVCRQDNVCQCHPHYSGNGRTCTVIQQCEFKNGGCSHHADCQQINTTIHCSCHEDYTGDGVMCRGVDRCEIDNGGCHRNASCRYTGPNSNYCSCIYPYQGDGIDCTLSIPPIQPCVNGFSSECSENAYCNYILPSDALPYGDVRCICKSNYIGNGTMCNGNVYETLASIRFISEFFR